VKLRIYIDTSVFSAESDGRSPDRAEHTAEFFGRLSEFSAVSSELVRSEIESTPDAARRSRMLELLSRTEPAAVTDPARALARAYLDAGIFSAAVASDALHIGVAVVSGCDALVSWNFKHLVNQRRRGMVNALNTRLGHPSLLILPPPEL
jgi:predicted nucleic acid-binding protein